MFQGMKKVLIVDDDDYFREVLQQSIEECGFEVVTASDVMFAEKTIEAVRPQLVFTDIRMPGKSGIDLLRWVRAHHPEIPVVMMTAFTDVANALTAHREGAVGFLSKPFRLEEIESFLSRLSSEEGFESRKVQANQRKFVEVPIADFISGKRFRSNIYLRINDVDQTRFIKIAHSGEDLTPERIHSFQESGIRAFYIESSDDEKMPLVKGTESFESRIKLLGPSGFRITTQKLANWLLTQGVSESDLNEARSVLDEAFQILSADPITEFLLDSLKVISNEIYEESILVAIVAAILFQKNTPVQSRTPTSLVIGALLHDIGKRQLNPVVLSKPRSECTASDRLHIETHVTRSYEILSQLKLLPPNVIEAVFQHHERIDGTGYPNHLVGTQIHLHALLIGLADESVQILLENKTMPAAEWIAQLKAEKEREFPAPLFSALERVFHCESSIPQDEWIDRAG